MPRSISTRAVSLAAFIICAAFIATIFVSAGAAAATIHVPGDYTTIQAAVNHANPGDTVQVGSGTYHENVNVDKAITLAGVDTGSGLPVVIGGGGSAITVAADYVNVSGFNLTGATNSDCAGIYVTADNAIIEGNNASGNNLGIYLLGSSNDLIANNLATDSSNYGIAVRSSSHNTLTGNTVNDNIIGIDFLVTSDYNTVNGNTVYDNQNGINFELTSEYNTVNGNTVYDNQEGICFDDSGNNRMYLNRFLSNVENMYTSTMDMFSDPPTNYWNSTDVMQYSYNGAAYSDYLGNYWDDYTGTDADLNGIGDTSFALMGTDVDYRPLMAGFTLQANFTANVTAGIAPLTVQFNDTSYGNPVAWQWNFGDGTPNSTDRNATHVYATTGTYTVTLTVINDDGNNTVQKAGYITVSTLPVLNVNTGVRYSTIQAAINAASPGDNITVNSGTYRENVALNKAITLTGLDTGSGLPVVDGNGNTVFTISASGVTLQNFNITNATSMNSCGIIVPDNTGSNANIINNTVTGSYRGIGLFMTNNINLTGNTANNNTDNGIHLYSSSNINLTGNTANSDNSGIYLYSSSNNNLTGNTANSNGIGVGGVGITLGDSSSNNNLTGNTANNNSYGIYLYSSSNNNLTGNTANNNSYGIHLDSSSNNNLTGNTANNNTLYGIHLDLGSNSNNLTGNTANNNSYGIYISTSSYNVLWLNRLNNTRNVLSDGSGPNYWNSTAPLTYTDYNGHPHCNYTGNYWSQYLGTDSDHDGIVDQAYAIDGNNVDNYPMLDAAVPAMQIASAAYSVNENAGKVTIQLTRDVSTGTPGVDYTTNDFTAVADENYTAVSDTATFQAGNTSCYIDVPILDNSYYDCQRQFFFNISDPTDGGLGAITGCVITINEDDPAPVVQIASATYSVNENGGKVTVQLSRSDPAPVWPCSVSYATADGNATAPANYASVSGTATFSADNSTFYVDVPVVDDGVWEDHNRYFTLSISSPNNCTLGSTQSTTIYLTETDTQPSTMQIASATYNVNENAGKVTIQLTRDVSAGTPSVQYATIPGTALAGSNYTATSGTAHFQAGNASYYIDVPILDNSVYDTARQFTFTISSPAGGSLGATTTATVTINEDDPTPAVQFSAASYSVNEADGTITITVMKTGTTTQPCSVNYATNDGSATMGVDYTSTSGTLDFAAADTSKTFQVSIIDRHIAGTSAMFFVNLTNPTTCTLGSHGTAPVYIQQNGILPVAGFHANQTVGVGSLCVGFTDDSTGYAGNWQWQFGDGSGNATTQNPAHIYSAPGTYTVTLTVSNANGTGTLQRTAYITVTTAVNGGNSINDPYICPISGNVTLDGVPVFECVVNATPGLTTVTDPDGNYTVKALPGADVTITYTYRGYSKTIVLQTPTNAVYKNREDIDFSSAQPTATPTPTPTPSGMPTTPVSPTTVPGFSAWMGLAALGAIVALAGTSRKR